MIASNGVTIWGAIVAAVAGLAGYVLTQRAERTEHKRKAFADSIAAVERYADLPYRIRRRVDSQSDCREELANAINDVAEQVDLHLAWLSIESKEVGEAYAALVNRTRHPAIIFRRDAWHAGPADDDKKMAFISPFDYDNRRERFLCIRAMRAEVSLTGGLARAAIRRELAALVQERLDDLGPLVFSETDVASLDAAERRSQHVELMHLCDQLRYANGIFRPILRGRTRGNKASR